MAPRSGHGEEGRAPTTGGGKSESCIELERKGGRGPTIRLILEVFFGTDRGCTTAWRLVRLALTGGCRGELWTDYASLRLVRMQPLLREAGLYLHHGGVARCRLQCHSAQRERREEKGEPADEVPFHTLGGGMCDAICQVPFSQTTRFVVTSERRWRRVVQLPSRGRIVISQAGNGSVPNMAGAYDDAWLPQCSQPPARERAKVVVGSRPIRELVPARAPEARAADRIVL